MMDLNTAVSYAQGMKSTEPNVEVVRMMGVRIISGSIPREVRAELSRAVKAGRIGRLPKKGLMPEAYFHPNAKWEAMEQRERIARESVEAIAKVMA